jgi:hypothetical protein
MSKKTSKGKVVKQDTPTNKNTSVKKEKDKSKKVDDLVKGSDKFKNAIIDHLKDTARKDKLFINTLKKKNKSIDSCIAYILTTVKKSGMQGFEDGEIFKMARHYYDEDDIIVVPFTSQGMIVMNQQIALTQEEIDKAKQEARDRVISDEMVRMRKKPEKKKSVIVPTKEEKKEDSSDSQASLF